MNFQQIIDKRQSLTFDQLQELKAILVQGLRKEQRIYYISVIDNYFYTLFDGHPFAHRFYIYGGRVEHSLSKDNMKLFRQQIKETFL